MTDRIWNTAAQRWDYPGENDPGLAERLRAVTDKHGIMYDDADTIDQAANTIERLTNELREAREALECIVAGNVPRPIGVPWRADGKPSKLDLCPHSVTVSAECGSCTDDFILKTLASQDDKP